MADKHSSETEALGWALVASVETLQGFSKELSDGYLQSLIVWLIPHKFLIKNSG
jgi:hypothetical protein